MQAGHDRPWMLALESQFAALKIARIEANEARPSVVGGMADYNASILLPRAVPFAWSAETISAVWLASKTIPLDATIEPDIIPEEYEAAWWWLGEWPLPIPLRDRKNIVDDFMDADCISGLLLARYEGRLLIIDSRISDVGPMMTGFLVPPFGVALREFLSGSSFSYFKSDKGYIEAPSDRALHLTRFLMAAAAWLRQRIVTVSSGHIERHRRKQIAREHDVLMSDVKVISLRRAEHQPESSSPNSGDVDWSCRWIVSGHWRNQYHPSTGKHELKYILPYVKGPEDKPLKVPTQTVYAVNR